MTEPGNMPLMGSHQACVLIRDVSVSVKQGLELLTSYQTCWKGKQIQDLAVGVLSWVPEGFLSRAPTHFLLYSRGSLSRRYLRLNRNRTKPRMKSVWCYFYGCKYLECKLLKVLLKFYRFYADQEHGRK